MKFELCAFADEAGNTLQEQIKALKENNISLLEIRNIDGQNIADISEEKAIKIKTALDKENIRVFSIGSPIGKTKISEDFTDKEKLVHILDLCKIFECNKIRIFSFFTSNPQRDRDKIIERLKILVEIAAKQGVRLYHENEKHIYGDTVNRVIDILDNVEGLCSVYDPANYIQTGENINYALKKVFDRAGYFHIKDVIKSTGELVPAGEGDGQIKKMISMFLDNTTLSVEPHLAIFDGYKSIDAEEMKNKYHFTSNRAAFDCAVNSLKALIERTQQK